MSLIVTLYVGPDIATVVDCATVVNHSINSKVGVGQIRIEEPHVSRFTKYLCFSIPDSMRGSMPGTHIFKENGSIRIETENEFFVVEYI